MDANFVYSVDEAVQAAKVSRSYLYGAIRRGELRVTKLGRRTLIRREALQSWIERAEAAGSPDVQAAR